MYVEMQMYTVLSCAYTEPNKKKDIPFNIINFIIKSRLIIHGNSKSYYHGVSRDLLMGLIYGDIPGNIYIYSHSIWQTLLSRATHITPQYS